MIYYTNKARETARENIARLIPIVATIPGDKLSYMDAHEVIGYLQALDLELGREIREDMAKEQKAAALENLKSEIDRAFRVLGADKGLDQNAVDIINWREQGMITEEEYKELRKYNRKAYHDLPLDM